MVLGNFQCPGILHLLAVGADWGYFDYHLPFFLFLNIDRNTVLKDR